ncbi:MAG TPA: ABC transporter permease [bacterium]|nr:ABC transporter permease [bacterium]
MITQFGTTFRLSLVEQKHNRFAIALLLCYLPGWYGIIAALSAGTIAFKLRAFGIIVITTQERLGLLTGMLNATTLIMGFVGLTVMRQSEAVDQRLVLCGHSRTALVLGRLLALGLVSLAVAAYATGVLALFFPLRHFALVAVGSFVAIAAYVAIGMLVGVVLPGDLEGLFFIIMLSIVDTFMQNPVGSAAANHQVVEFFPSYLPMQMVVAGALTGRVAWWQFWAGLGWAAGFGALVLAAFWYRTRTEKPYG